MKDQNRMFLITLTVVLGFIYLMWNFFSPKYDEPTSEKMVKEAFVKVLKTYYTNETDKLTFKKEKNYYVYEGDVDSLSYGKICKEHYKLELRIKSDPFKVIVMANVFLNGFFAGQFNVNLKNNTIS